MTYGIKRLAIPEQEIKEYYGYSFSDQGILAIIYNNFTKERGFIGEKNNSKDYAAEISKREIKHKWCITRDQLCLSTPILEEHKKENWRSFVEEFKIVDNFQSAIIDDDEIPFNDKLRAIENRTQMFYKKKFRPIREEGQNGVENFFSFKREYSIDPISTYIANLIESDLFNQWKNGLSLKDVEGFLGALREMLKQEKSSLKQLESVNAARIKELDRAIEKSKEEWADTGFFSKIGHKTGLGSNVDIKASDFSALAA